jgi:hypothetical protein
LHRGTDHRCVCALQTLPCVRPNVCSPLCLWVLAPTYPRRTVRALFVSVDHVQLRSQVFQLASAFNANISAWNTASVTSLCMVCAASGRRRATAGGWRAAGGRARLVFDAARPMCAAAPPMRVRAHGCAGVHGLGYGCSEERFDTCIRMYIIYEYVDI